MEKTLNTLVEANLLTADDVAMIESAFNDKLQEKVENVKKEYEAKLQEEIENVKAQSYEEVQTYIQEASEKLSSLISTSVEPIIEQYFSEHRQAFENEQNVQKINAMMEAFKALIEIGKEAFQKIEEGEDDFDVEEASTVIENVTVPSMDENWSENKANVELMNLKKEKIINTICEGMSIYQKSLVEKACNDLTYLPSLEKHFVQQVNEIKNGVVVNNNQNVIVNRNLLDVDTSKYSHLI